MEAREPAPPSRPSQCSKDFETEPVRGAAGSYAPTYTVPLRRLGAVEHPMIIKDLEKAIETFGQTHSFKSALYSPSPKVSIPLYFRPDNPTVRPLTSHNAPTRNVVVKVTVPKRTGRKRKRGSDAPFESTTDEPDGGEIISQSAGDVCSRARLDEPKVLRRKLADNIGKYTIEPVGMVKNTHRYRGSADFQYSMGSSRFMNDFVENVLSGSVPKLRQFSFKAGVDRPPNVDLVPPPLFTPVSMPFPYNYSQNPNVKEVDAGSAADARGLLSDADEFDRMVNTTTKAPTAGYFIGCDEHPVPTRPRSEPNLADPHVAAIIKELRRAMDERPVWTRRSMLNRLSESFVHLPKRGSLVRYCMNYAGYQFKGGPWRDSLVRYGVDPRTDPKYRIYQTLIFKLSKTHVGDIGRSWQSVRRAEVGMSANLGELWRGKGSGATSRRTHEFDGEQFSTDGKVWQVCDITDPLLAKLFAESDVLPTCDLEGGGFYPSPLWAIAKGIMKRKMVAIRFGRTLDDSAFEPALRACKEVCRNGGPSASISVPLPDLNLTGEERAQLSGRRFKGSRRRKYRGSNKVRTDFSVLSIKIPGMGKGRQTESLGALSDTASRGSEPDVNSRPGHRLLPDEILPGIEEDDEKEEEDESGVDEDSLQGLLESDEDDNEGDSVEESETDEDIEEEDAIGEAGPGVAYDEEDDEEEGEDEDDEAESEDDEGVDDEEEDDQDAGDDSTVRSAFDHEVSDPEDEEQSGKTGVPEAI